MSPAVRDESRTAPRAGSRAQNTEEPCGAPEATEARRDDDDDETHASAKEAKEDAKKGKKGKKAKNSSSSSSGKKKQDPWSCVDDLSGTKLYEVLGIQFDATCEEIKKAWREKARKHHPDKGGDAEKFAAIQKAFETLSDAVRGFPTRHTPPDCFPIPRLTLFRAQSGAKRYVPAFPKSHSTLFYL